MSDAANLVPKYEPGEKLLCFHGPLLYEAKCLDVKVKEDGVLYFVHYQGWNKNWDEWVTDKRIFKYNEEGLRKQKELEQQIKSGKKVKVLRKSDLKKQAYPPPEIMEEIEQTLRPVENKHQEVKQQPETKVKVKPAAEVSPSREQAKQPTNITPPTEPVTVNSNKPSESSKSTTLDEPPPPASHTPASNRRRKGRTGLHDGSMENDEGFLTAPQLKVDLPPNLRAWLVDDWDLITRQARLYELPASCPISSIMLDFLQHAGTNDVKQEPSENTPSPQGKLSITSDIRHEFVAGLQHYFNQIIGSQLLYKFERLQYAELLKQHADKRMSDVYGSIHLLRLFVKLREMVSCTRVDPSGLPILEALVKEFLEFLRLSEKTYFKIENYTVATAEYQRRAMC